MRRGMRRPRQRRRRRRTLANRRLLRVGRGSGRRQRDDRRRHGFVAAATVWLTDPRLAVTDAASAVVAAQVPRHERRLELLRRADAEDLDRVERADFFVAVVRQQLQEQVPAERTTTKRKHQSAAS